MTDQEDAAIELAKKVERNREWREQNRAALLAYAEEVTRDGLPLAKYRSF
jgi:antitoxin CcdA